MSKMVSTNGFLLFFVRKLLLRPERCVGTQYFLLCTSPRSTSMWCCGLLTHLSASNASLYLRTMRWSEPTQEPSGKSSEEANWCEGKALESHDHPDPCP
eukprot:4795501-Amphidinium_carterae.1